MCGRWVGMIDLLAFVCEREVVDKLEVLSENVIVLGCLALCYRLVSLLTKLRPSACFISETHRRNSICDVEGKEFPQKSRPRIK